MILHILANTPIWVFALFVLLFAFGLLQTRTRRVRRWPALGLPAGMVALSLAGIQSSFGFTTLPLATWATALAIAAALGHLWFRDPGVAYDAGAQTFVVPGQWMPLAVIMAIFFAKYVHAVMRAFDAPVLSTTPFVVALSAVYGLLSGYFVAKALNLLRLAREA